MIQGPVIILADGDFPSHLISLGKLQDAQTIICCDGSVNNLVKNKMEPHYILGDMDSIDDNLKNKYRDKIIELPGQDENDLRKAIVWVESHGAKKAAILGATGKRDDHTLANIFTLLQYPSQLEMTIYTDHGIFSVAENKKTFDSFTGQQISLFATDKSIEITSNNLKYNFTNNTISTLYNGTLNESISDFFKIQDYIILIFKSFNFCSSKKINFRKYNLDILINYYLKKDNFDLKYFLSITNFVFFKKLHQNNIDLSLVLDWYEN